MARNLSVYDAKANEYRPDLSIVAVGDSNTMPLGVTDGWFEICQKTLSAHRFVSRGLGFRSLIRGAEWSQAGTWTQHATTVAYDKTPFGIGWRGTTATSIYTYTPLAGETIAAGSRLLYIDTAGHGNPSYSIDSGAWTTFGITPAADNGLKAITLPAATTNVRVRAATSAGVDCQLDLWGIEVRNAQTSGVFWHNCAVSLHRLSGPFTATRPLVRTSSGDPLAWLDFFDPDLLIVAFVNDANNASPAATLDPALQTLIDRQKGNGGDVLIVRYPEIGDGTSPSYANQDAIRDEFVAEATENDCALVDVYTSFGPFAVSDAAGYFQADNTHISTLGHEHYADIVWRLLAQTGPSVRV